jgi:hypothetical protein
VWKLWTTETGVDVEVLETDSKDGALLVLGATAYPLTLTDVVALRDALGAALAECAGVPEEKETD